jgi:hypothetical protein
MFFMSQMSWQQPGENENNDRPSSRENKDKNRYEGFEGMNYEQRRQPFRPQHASNNNNKKSSGEEGKAPNEA